MQNSQTGKFHSPGALFYLWTICVFSTFGFYASALYPQAPLSLSMSGSGRAIAEKGAEYHLLNPAGIIYAPAFHAAGFYVFKSEERKPYWGVSLMENRQIPIALSYIKKRQSEEQYISISTAAFILPGWSLGLSLSRWKTDQDTNWNIQAGFLIKPKQSPFSIGATWDHLLPVEEGAFKDKRQWALGGEYKLYKWLHLRADGIYHQKEHWLISGGVETTISGFLVVRFASRWRFARKAFVFSGGVGLETKQIALDYGLSQTENKKQWLHTVNVRGQF